MTRWMAHIWRSAGMMHVAASMLQRVNTIVLTIAIGQFRGLEAIGSWAVGQTFALAIQGPIGMALAQVLIASSDDANAEGRHRRFLMALKLSTIATGAVLVLAILLTIAQWLPQHWMVLNNGALVAVGVYTLGGTTYMLVSAKLLVEDDRARLFKLASVGAAATLLPVSLLYDLSVWEVVTAVGAATGLGSIWCASMTWPDARVLWQQGARDTLRRTLPLALGNSLLNPAVFVSVSVVGAHGGMAAAAIYGIGNQLRNALIMPVALLLPVYLRHWVVKKRNGMVLYGVTVVAGVLVLVPLMLFPQIPFRIFSSTVPTPEALTVARLAILSIPLLVFNSLAGQIFIATGRLWTTFSLNMSWCLGLLIGYLALEGIGSPAERMSIAQMMAYGVVGLGTVLLRLRLGERHAR